jgi:hypothetical protein
MRQDFTKANPLELTQRMSLGKDQLERVTGQGFDRQASRHVDTVRYAHDGEVGRIGLHHAPGHARRCVDQSQPDLRMRQTVGGDHVPERTVQHGSRRGQTQHPLRPSLQVREDLAQRIEALDQRGGQTHEPLSVFGQADRPALGRDETDPVVILKRADLAPDGGGGHAQRPGRGREAALARDLEQRPDLTEADLLEISAILGLTRTGLSLRCSHNNDV